MTGFYLPNYGAAQNQGPSFGLAPLRAPDMYQLPNWELGPAATGAGAGAALPGATAATDQARFSQLNQAMQPNSILPWINAGIQGVGALGNLWLGWQGLRQARQDATWQRGMAEKNYWNSVQNYNTAVEDRVRSRYGPAGAAQNQGTIDSEVTRRRIGGQ